MSSCAKEPSEAQILLIASVEEEEFWWTV